MENVYVARVHGWGLANNSGVPMLGAMGSTEDSVVSLLVVLGSSLSLVGLVFAFITYSLFSDLRSLSGTALMNLLAALFMSQLLYVIGVGGPPLTSDGGKVCECVAGGLQFSRLSALAWLLVMTHHLYTLCRDNFTLVPAADPNIAMRFARYSAFAWGIPVVLVAGSVLLQRHLNPTSPIADPSCWFLEWHLQLGGLVVPGLIMVTFSIWYLVRAALVSRLVAGMQADRRMRRALQRARYRQIFLFIKIATVMCTVILLGVIAQRAATSTALWISFHAAQGAQGLLIAALLTCNCQVLKIYSRTVRKRKRPSVIPTEISRSTSLQLLTWDPAPDPV